MRFPLLYTDAGAPSSSSRAVGHRSCISAHILAAVGRSHTGFSMQCCDTWALFLCEEVKLQHVGAKLQCMCL